MADKYVGGKQASEILKVHQRTLHNWDANGKIEVKRTPGGKRLYNVGKFLKVLECNNDKNCIKNLEELDAKEGKLNIGYVRVSTHIQSSDLVNQKRVIQEKYPNHLIIEDIGSGINLNRRGLRKIIDLAIAGKIREVVVVFKDRLTRFGYELIEDIIKKYSQGIIRIVNENKELEPEDELAQDVLQIMDVFAARMNGLKKYKKLIEAKK